jgi:hypothetical protein
LSYEKAQNDSVVKLASDLASLATSLTALALSLWAVRRVIELAPAPPSGEKFLQTLSRLKSAQKKLKELIDEFDRTGGLQLADTIDELLDSIGRLYSKLTDYAYMLRVKPGHRPLLVSFADACDDVASFIGKARLVFNIPYIKESSLVEFIEYSPRKAIAELFGDETAKTLFDTLVKIRDKVEATTKRRVELRSADYRSFTVIDLARDIAEISRALIEFAQSEIEPLNTRLELDAR